MREINFFSLHPAEQINPTIATLPVARRSDVIVDGQQQKKFIATVVNDEVIDISSDRYALVQHGDAFRPIIEGLTVMGAHNFRFSSWSTNRKASMSVYVGEASDTVSFGFRVRNSFDRSSSIHYGFEANQQESETRIIQREHVLVWGMRQVCENGMMMRVPIKTNKYLDAELIIKLKNLFSMAHAVRHVGNANEQVKQVQFIVEGFLLLKQPINAMIADAQGRPIESWLEAPKLILKYVGKRNGDMFVRRFRHYEEPTLWGLFNAVTWVASHREDLSVSRREGLIEKASEMLENELLPVAVVR